jgi:hypothetical protein
MSKKLKDKVVYNAVIQGRNEYNLSYTTKAIFQAKKQSIANAQMSLVKLYLPKKERKQIIKNNLR